MSNRICINLRQISPDAAEWLYYNSFSGITDAVFVSVDTGVPSLAVTLLNTPWNAEQREKLKSAFDKDYAQGPMPSDLARLCLMAGERGVVLIEFTCWAALTDALPTFDHVNSILSCDEQDHNWLEVDEPDFRPGWLDSRLSDNTSTDIHMN